MTTWYEVQKVLQSFGYEVLNTSKQSITYRPFDHSKIDHERLSLAFPIEKCRLEPVIRHILSKAEFEKWQASQVPDKTNGEGKAASE